MPPPAAKKGVYIAGKNKKLPDPWCLVCGVNLRLDGRSFVVLTSGDAEETRKLFVQILGVQFRSDYASVNLCNKCERSLKRINRYAGLESAKSEADILKKSLTENLKNKGQDTVEASEADKFEVNNFKGTDPKRVSKRYTKKSEPLIEEEAEDWNQDWEHEADDSENIDTNKMPFGFLKKSKKDKKDKKDKKKENEVAADDAKPEDQKPIVDAPDADQTPAPRVFKEGTTLAAMASTVPKKPEPVKDDSKDEEYPDGGFVPNSSATPSNDTKTSQPVAQEKVNPEKLTDTDETELKKLEVKDAPAKGENSPLINKNGDVKESKLQDQQPGMLCCTIL